MSIQTLTCTSAISKSLNLPSAATYTSDIFFYCKDPLVQHTQRFSPRYDSLVFWPCLIIEGEVRNKSLGPWVEWQPSHRRLSRRLMLCDRRTYPVSRLVPVSRGTKNKWNLPRMLIRTVTDRTGF